MGQLEEVKGSFKQFVYEHLNISVTTEFIDTIIQDSLVGGRYVLYLLGNYVTNELHLYKAIHAPSYKCLSIGRYKNVYNKVTSSIAAVDSTTEKNFQHKAIEIKVVYNTTIFRSSDSSNNRYSCTNGTCVSDPNGKYSNIEECTTACGPAPGPAGINYKGLRTWGNCHNTTQNRSAGQCDGQFNKCQQPYAFPYYYYDKYAVRKMTKHIQPNKLISTTLQDASSICSTVYPKTWKQLNISGDVTWKQIAQIFKANNRGKDKDCPYALILAIGECQNNSAQTGCLGVSQPNNQNYPASIWQNGDNSDNPDQSATAIYKGVHSIQALCNGSTPSIIPNGYISAGNTNWLGPFCHINNGGGAAWGGGMCAGGISDT